MCTSHLGVSKRQDADNHYRAVCRALVLETLELSSFLEKVSQGTKELRTDQANPCTDLDQLKFTDWVSTSTRYPGRCSLVKIMSVR